MIVLAPVPQRTSSFPLDLIFLGTYNPHRVCPCGSITTPATYHELCLNCLVLAAAAPLGCCLPRGCDLPSPSCLHSASTSINHHNGPWAGRRACPSAIIIPPSPGLGVPQKQAWSALTNRPQPHRTLACSIPAVPLHQVQCEHLQVPGRGS